MQTALHESGHVESPDRLLTDIHVFDIFQFNDPEQNYTQIHGLFSLLLKKGGIRNVTVKM